MQMPLYDKIQETIVQIREWSTLKPQVGIILGTGLGAVAHGIEKASIIPYAELFHFPNSTVEGHAGNIIMGYIESTPVIVFQGRLHYYEGYSLEQVTFPVRIVKGLGAQTLLLTNAAGGIHQDYSPGDVVLVDDHINLLPDNPLRGLNDSRLGQRFPDMSKAYAPNLIRLATEMADRLNIQLHTGTYACLPGPNLETKAEYKYLKIIGADLVGMSTVPEVIVARQADLQTIVLSVVSNACDPDRIISETSLQEIIDVVNNAGPRVTALIREIIREIGLGNQDKT